MGNQWDILQSAGYPGPGFLKVGRVDCILHGYAMNGSSKPSVEVRIGTDIRVPFFTSFDPKTGSWIIENHGVDPDILIDNDPVKEWNGEDQQLDRAIQEVMKELQNRKPLPGVPTPRDFSK